VTPDKLAALNVGTIKRSLDGPLTRIATLEQQHLTLADDLRRVRDQLVELQAQQAARERDPVR